MTKAKPLAGHGIHSPFVFHLASEILQNAGKAKVELLPVTELRKVLATDNRKVNIVNLGARHEKRKQKTVKQVFSQSVSRQKYIELLFVVVKEFQPAQIIELGTSLGVATAAMALARSNSKIITVEGCHEIASVAGENFSKLSITNIRQEIAPFDEALPKILSKMTSPFFAFMDGNHRYEATIKYFDQIIEKANVGSVIVLDDIHWSKDMEKAWNEIRKNKKVSISIDLYQMGLIFLREGAEKQDFWIRY